LRVKIQGYGEVVVRVPKKDEWCNASIKQAVMDGITETLQLVDPQTRKDRWHPVLGQGGYDDVDKQKAKIDGTSAT
jgi:hypothetical protein